MKPEDEHLKIQNIIPQTSTLLLIMFNLPTNNPPKTSFEVTHPTISTGHTKIMHSCDAPPKKI